MAAPRPKPKQTSGTQPRRCIAYLRTSTGKQDLQAQQTGIVEFAQRHGLQPLEFVEEVTSGKTPVAERRLGKELLPSLHQADVLIVGEISRLGRTQRDVLVTLHALAEKGVTVRIVKGDMNIDQSIPSKVYVSMLSLMAEIERDLVSARTKEGLAKARANGKRLGRPPGLPPRSKLDPRAADIKALASKGVGPMNLARVFDVNYGTMKKWLRNHSVRVRRGANGACHDSLAAVAGNP